MKKILVLIFSISFLVACNNTNPGETGVVNDGIKTTDSNGALSDTIPAYVDTLNEFRVDIQQRDTIRRPN